MISLPPDRILSPIQGKSRFPFGIVCSLREFVAKGFDALKWEDEKARASMVVTAGGEEYIVMATDNTHITTPESDEKKVLQVNGDNTDPIQDSGPNSSVSPNKAPPAAPFPAKVAPKSSQPDNNYSVTDGPGTQKPPVPDDPDDNPDSQEYVSSRLGDKQPKDGDIKEREKRASNPHQDQVKNPDGGAADPNPNNDTYIPKGGHKGAPDTSWLMGGKQDVDTFDDDSAKPNIKDKPTFMGDGQDGVPTKDDHPVMQWEMGRALRLKVDAATSLAKWPLSFDVIEKDFKRPNKDTGKPIVDPQDGGNQDAEKDYEDNRPYQAILPKTK